MSTPRRRHELTGVQHRTAGVVRGQRLVVRPGPTRADRCVPRARLRVPARSTSWCCVRGARLTATSMRTSTDRCLIGRLLPLPTPTPTLVHVVQYGMVVMASPCWCWSPGTGRRRVQTWLGAACFCSICEWMVISFSYGKVDHDRFAFLVALAVLPTAGRAALRDMTPSPAGGLGAAHGAGRRRWPPTSSPRSPRCGSAAGVGSTRPRSRGP